MFTSAFKNFSSKLDVSKPIGSYFSFQDLDDDFAIEQDNAPQIKRYHCLFQPIYLREKNAFVPAGHKVVARPISDNTNQLRFTPENVDPSSVDLLRALEMGACQFEIISSQINTFLAHKRDQEQQKLVFEIDTYEFANNPLNLVRLKDIVDDAATKGVKASDIVIEISGSTSLDPGVVYTIAMQLKEMGVMLALNNMDADCFSFKRIFQIWPHVVKFNRSWCDLPTNDPNYLEMVITLVSAIQAKGIHAAFTNVQSRQDLQFATTCGFKRCQGSFFGLSTESMERGPIYRVMS